MAGTVPATRTSLWARMPSSRLFKLKGGDLKNCLALGVEVYRDQLDSIGSTADPDMTAPCTKC